MVMKADNDVELIGAARSQRCDVVHRPESHDLEQKRLSANYSPYAATRSLLWISGNVLHHL